MLICSCFNNKKLLICKNSIALNQKNYINEDLAQKQNISQKRHDLDVDIMMKSMKKGMRKHMLCFNNIQGVPFKIKKQK